MVREVTELVCARARAPEFQTQLCCWCVTEEGRAPCLQGACCLIGLTHTLSVFKYCS